MYAGTNAIASANHCATASRYGAHHSASATMAPNKKDAADGGDIRPGRDVPTVDESRKRSWSMPKLTSNQYSRRVSAAIIPVEILRKLATRCNDLAGEPNRRNAIDRLSSIRHSAAFAFISEPP